MKKIFFFIVAKFNRWILLCFIPVTYSLIYWLIDLAYLDFKILEENICLEIGKGFINDVTIITLEEEKKHNEDLNDKNIHQQFIIKLRS